MKCSGAMVDNMHKVPMTCFKVTHILNPIHFHLLQELSASTIECAAHEIFRDYIGNASKELYYEGGQKIYFDGWNGVGASAVLAAVAKLLSRSHQRHGFEIFIHVDCSQWESRRSLQRRIAEELKLGTSTMELFVKQDEEDVFGGVDKSSRAEIPDVGQQIYKMTKGRTLLVIFHNGSDDEIDLARLGLPMFGSGNRLLWTFRGRFRIYPAIGIRVKSCDYYLYVRNTTDKLKIVHEEASQVVVVGHDDISPTLIADCWFYWCFLYFNVSYYLLPADEAHASTVWPADDTHASNCWVCDGIIPDGDSAWQIGERLQEALRLEDIPDTDNTNAGLFPIIPFQVLEDKRSVWLSVRYKNVESKNIQTVPEDTTSYFLRICFPPTALPKNLFHQSSKLRVLSLSCCCFSFASPPFICCRNLKLILVEFCKDEDAEFIGETHNKEKVKDWEFLKSIWVLDIRETNWDWILSPSKMRLMTQLRELNLNEAGASSCVCDMAKLELAWLCNLHRLRVICSYTFITALAQDAFMGMQKLELLDLSGNLEMEVLPNFSAATRLSVLIVDGCSRLQHVEPGTLPKSLESFSFDGFGKACGWKNSVQMPENQLRPTFRNFYLNTPKVSKISLQGCEELKNIFLRGLPNLNELNLSDTAIKSLDLEAIQVAQIERLFILGWRNHGSLRWGAGGHPRVKLLLIDLRQKEEMGPVDDYCQYYSCPLVQQEASQQMIHIVGTDAKFLRAFKMSGGFGNISGITESNQHFHIHLASGGGQRKVIGNNEERVTITSIVGYPYMDVHNKVIKRDDNGEACTNHVTLGRHIEIAKGGCNWESGEQMKIMEHLVAKVESFHMHDHSSVTTGNLEIKTYTELFPNIRWCCIQRCPKLHTIFLVDRYQISRVSFEKMDTLCVSHLLALRCVWSRNLRFSQDRTGPFRAFQNLRYIHLNSCPRLMFVLSWCFPTLASLETIHITYCGEIRQIFPKRGDYIGEFDCNNIEFPSLKNIHLHELPMLQHICEIGMLAPALETIVLRGCWSLKQLPAINSCRTLDKPLVVVDCEKDWWDKLKWDGLEASRPLFSPRHSRYYKKVLPRVSVLR